ncbi:MAG: HEAT repeat domain-containing protein, partial [Planctomycetota bacterium]
ELGTLLVEAALDLDFDDAATLVRPWVDLQASLTDAPKATWTGDSDVVSLTRMVLDRLEEHPDADVRFAAANAGLNHVTAGHRFLHLGESRVPRERQLGRKALVFTLEADGYGATTEELVSAIANFAGDEAACQSIAGKLDREVAQEVWAAALRAAPGMARLVVLERGRTWFPAGKGVQAAAFDKALAEMASQPMTSEELVAVLSLERVQTGHVAESLLRLIVAAAIEDGSAGTRRALDYFLQSSPASDVWLEAYRTRVAQPESDPQKFYRDSSHGAAESSRLSEALEIAVSQRVAPAAGALLSAAATGLGFPPHWVEDPELFGELLGRYDVETRVWLLKATGDEYRPIFHRRLNTSGWQKVVSAVPEAGEVAARLMLTPGVNSELKLGAVGVVPFEDPRGPSIADELFLIAATPPEGISHMEVIGGLRFRGCNEVVAQWVAARPTTDRELPYQYARLIYDAHSPGAFDAACAILEYELRFGEFVSSVAVDLATALASEPARRQEAVELLDRLFRSSAIELAISAAGTLSWQELIPGLSEAARDSSSFVREAALRALLRFPEQPEAVEVVRRALLDQNSRVRAEARSVIEQWQLMRETAEGLGPVPTKQQARAELFGMLESPEPAVRAEAARALATMGAVEALPRLIRMLADEDVSVREAVRGALDRLHEREPDPELADPDAEAEPEREDG